MFNIFSPTDLWQSVKQDEEKVRDLFNDPADLRRIPLAEGFYSKKSRYVHTLTTRLIKIVSG